MNAGEQRGDLTIYCQGMNVVTTNMDATAYRDVIRILSRHRFWFCRQVVWIQGTAIPADKILCVRFQPKDGTNEATDSSLP